MGTWRPGRRAEVSVAVLLDVDGTLVDTNYHHALAWHRALRRYGATVPLWRLHRHMGMGGDQLVASAVGEEFDAEHGDDARAAEKEEYARLVDEVVPLPQARELVEDLRERGCRVILASSAKDEEVEHYIELLGAGDIDRTSSGDVATTKPAPDLVEAAVEKAGGPPAVLIGDSTWDCKAAERAGVRTIGLLTGGFSREELLEAGAEAVFESIDELREALDDLL